MRPVVCVRSTISTKPTSGRRLCRDEIAAGLTGSRQFGSETFAFSEYEYTTPEACKRDQSVVSNMRHADDSGQTGCTYLNSNVEMHPVAVSLTTIQLISPQCDLQVILIVVEQSRVEEAILPNSSCYWKCEAHRSSQSPKSP